MSRGNHLTQIYISGFKLKDIPAEYARRYGLLVSYSSVRGMKFTAEQRVIHASNQVVTYSRGRNGKFPDDGLTQLKLLMMLRQKMITWPQLLSDLQVDLERFLTELDTQRWQILQANFPKTQSNAELRHMLSQMDPSDIITFDQAKGLLKNK